VLYSANESRSLQERIVVATIVAIGLLGGLPRAGAGAGSARAVSSDPVFKALLLDGRTVSGRIVSLGPAAIRLASAGGTEHELPLEGLIKLTREAPAALEAADRSLVIFPEGDCLTRVAVGASTETALEVTSDVLGKLVLPLDCLLGVIVAAPAQTDELDALCDRVRLEARTTEVVWLANGDKLSGGFLGLNDRKIKIQIDGKPVEVERAGVLAVGFDPAVIDYPRPKSDFMELTLNDGTRLGITSAKIDDGSVQARARFGQSVRFPLGELIRVHARSSSVVYLSERKPARAVYHPYVGPTRDYRSDRTVDGHLFQLAGQTYDHGIGTQSRTLLAYALEPGDRRFQALVGVDERAGPLGSVVFRVLVDGKERFKTPSLTDRDVPRPIDLDVSGGKFLILDTDFGERGNVRDFADWVEARLIRSTASLSR
jgi:hypothetical protein